ncbi:hypothetical protein G2W53_009979 [Senna tora]|uniref:Uncharacterized protein n=1 Tax=Senna tora TaxID=362788 RepID=A0A834WZK7_9FABA|nr:hypothetical protein G2W53_009979 [Senna tora]
MELQERDRDLSPEEQDNLKRSTKKIKTQGESTTVDPAQGVEHEELSPKPMEESPEGKEKKEEVIPHLDSENGESKIKQEQGTGKPMKPTSVIGDSGKVEVGEEAFGPWMTVQLNRRRRPRPPAKNQQPASAPKYPNSGSRFKIFNLEESGDMNIDKVVEK